MRSSQNRRFQFGRFAILPVAITISMLIVTGCVTKVVEDNSIEFCQDRTIVESQGKTVLRSKLQNSNLGKLYSVDCGFNDIKIQSDRIIIPSHILFDTEKVNIKPQFMGVLRQVEAIIVTQDTHSVIMIEGHTDSRGDSQYNQRLSEKRALNVKNTLVSFGRLSAARIKTVGYGERRPLVPNASSAEMAINRRVEIVFREPVRVKQYLKQNGK